MRILFVNSLRGYYGGVEQVVQDYSRGLMQRGHECFLAYARDGRDPEVYKNSFTETYKCHQLVENEQGVTFQEIINKVSPEVVFVHKVEQLPRDFEKKRSYQRVLMVHDHDLWCPKGTGYYTRNRKICHKAAGLPCYLDGAFIERAEDGAIPFKYRSIKKKIQEMRRYQHFDTILVISEYLKQQLVKNRFSSEHIRIHNPVINQDVIDLVPLPEVPKILFVGSLIRGKGVDLLLRALAELSCDFQLDIVGTGKSEDELRNLATKLDLNNRLKFFGWVPHNKLSSFYHEARVVAIPSCWPEPFGLIGQEAMLHARPVVAFKVGGIPDWCDNGKNGFTVPEQDVAMFAKALERLLTDYQLAREMGLNGLRKVQSEFVFKDNLDQLESILSDAR